MGTTVAHRIGKHRFAVQRFNLSESLPGRFDHGRIRRFEYRKRRDHEREETRLVPGNNGKPAVPYLFETGRKDTCRREGRCYLAGRFEQRIEDIEYFERHVAYFITTRGFGGIRKVEIDDGDFQAFRCRNRDAGDVFRDCFRARLEVRGSAVRYGRRIR